jgi:hypothetical protein
VSLISNCIAKLVAAGKITPQVAAQANALHTGATQRLGQTMPAGTAAAQAALHVAQVMAQSAQARRWALAKQAISQADAIDRTINHPTSREAGAMSLLSRDIREKATGPNVFSHSEVIEGELLAPMTRALEEYSTSAARIMKGVADDLTGGRLGLSDPTSPRNVIRELRGVDTGDKAARALADGWKLSTDLATKMAKQAGYVFNEKADWVTPQAWSTGQVRGHGAAAFASDMLAAWDSGAMRVVREDGTTITNRIEAEAVVRTAGDDIHDGVGSGQGGAFDARQRRFNFTMDAAGAEAWIALADKYGAGRDIVSMLRGHIRRQALSIALAEILGPNHASTVAKVAAAVRQTEQKSINPLRFFESATTFEKAYAVASGAADAVSSELAAGIMGGLRHAHVAASMGSATVSAVFSDPATLMMASSHVGMSGGDVLRRVVADLSSGSGAERAEIASMLSLVAHSSADISMGGARYADDLVDRTTLSRVASSVMRVSGLEGWTQALKRSFTLEFLGFSARQAGNDFTAIDPALRGFLQRHGFNAAEWDVIRQAAPTVVNGARFFDHTAVADPGLGRRFMGAILDERGYAVLEPDFRIRAVTTAGQARGTWGGEIARSVGLYKSFSMSMMLMHGMRSWQALEQGYAARGVAGAVGGFATYGAPLLVSLTLGGALAVQAKQLLVGKDPRDMSSWKFWTEAFMQGGGAGIYGDLLNSAATRSGTSFVATLAGPLGSTLDQAAKLTFENMRQTVDGKKASFGKELADTLRRWTPGSNIWMTRLALDRLIFDSIQTMIDPEYPQSWARETQRMQREYGQGFWFERGQTTPSRAPQISMVQ